jgi:hypothetical protein
MKQNLFHQIKKSIDELINGSQTPPLPTTPTTRTFVVKVEKSLHQDQANQSPKLNQTNGLHDDLIVLPNDNPFALKQFTELHTTLVFKYILKRVRKAVKNDMSSVNLFQFGDTRKLAQISRTEYESQLNILMNYFVNIEDYELAARCRDTLVQHKQNEGRRPS